MTLGDRGSAAAATSSALAEAAGHISELRHPERAAAWLRARAMVRLARARRSKLAEDARRDALRPLGVDRLVYDRLARLTLAQRAALVAASVERFEPLDVEQILGRDAAATRRLLERARSRYLADATGRDPATTAPLPATARHVPGGVTERVNGVAARTVGASWRSA
ncbi:MAG TPA: hypothetical protein VHK63_00350 [Candidatus Limnocylindria bacterium]|nr:hypothetical protein [Candidatus Limnocylindria bacterium]